MFSVQVKSDAKTPSVLVGVWHRLATLRSELRGAVCHASRANLFRGHQGIHPKCSPRCVIGSGRSRCLQATSLVAEPPLQVSIGSSGVRLDPKRFRRIHRSTIVNLDHIVSCRPIDRRLCLTLSDGSEIVASRSGSQSLRDLFV